jgi:pimeloyl-ACP methyl ester carboxylesterase
MELDAFSLAKQFAHVGDARVAFTDHGEGAPVLLLHGCPFSSFVWRDVIPPLARAGHRCVAPDLLGLGDTETAPNADWSLPAQVAMVTGTQLPAIGPLFRLALSSPPIFKFILRAAKAVKHPSALTDELVAGYVRANLSDPHKRAKTTRFLAGQLDPTNNRHTIEALDGLCPFDRPTMLLWGSEDPHFGPEWADRLATDIRGFRRKELLPTGHLVMEEAPGRFTTLLVDFLALTDAATTYTGPSPPGRTWT